MRTTITAVALAVTALGLTACGSAGAADTADTAPTSKPSVSASPSEKAATVQQYAGIIAQHRADIPTTAEDVSSCNMDAAIDGTVSVLCGATFLIATTDAGTLNLRLEGAHLKRPGNKMYIGAPPAEIERLVADTEANTAAVAAINDRWSAGNCTMTHDCTSLYMELWHAYNSFEDTIARWEPYI